MRQTRQWESQGEKYGVSIYYLITGPCTIAVCATDKVPVAVS